MESINLVPSQIDNLYACAVCLEHLDKTTISLNPCGHELHESCALEVMKRAPSKCPECRVNIENYRPAYRTRGATEEIFKDLKKEIQVVVKFVKSLTGHNYTFTIDRNKRTVFLAKQLSDASNTPINHLQMHSGGCVLDFFEPLATYLKPDQESIQVYSSSRLGRGPYASKLIFDLALDAKLITKAQLNLYKSQEDFPERERVIYIITGLEQRIINKVLEIESK